MAAGILALSTLLQFLAAFLALRLVLVVDDEDLVRRATTRVLETAGFEVQAVESGRRAIELYEKGAGAFEVVVLDLTMPDLDGVQTFEELHRLDPEVKVLLVSGYDRSASTRGPLADRLAGFVQKPFTSRQLVDAVNGVLG